MHLKAHHALYSLLYIFVIQDLISLCLKQFAFRTKNKRKERKSVIGKVFCLFVCFLLIRRLFCEMLGNLPRLLPYSRTMRQPVVVLFYSWDISGVGRFGIKWKYNRSAAQNDVIFTPGEGCVLVITKPWERYNGARSKDAWALWFECYFFLYNYQALALLKGDRRRHRNLSDRHSRDMAQSVHLGKGVGDWETEVGVERQTFSFHKVRFVFEVFETICMEYIFNFYKKP